MVTYDSIVALRTWSTTWARRVVDSALDLFDRMRAEVAGAGARRVVAGLVGSVGYVVAGVVRRGLAAHLEGGLRGCVRGRVVDWREDDWKTLSLISHSCNSTEGCKTYTGVLGW